MNQQNIHAGVISVPWENGSPSGDCGRGASTRLSCVCACGNGGKKEDGFSFATHLARVRVASVPTGSRLPVVQTRFFVMGWYKFGTKWDFQRNSSS